MKSENQTKKFKIRGIENLHILLWIVKDTCWCQDYKLLGVSMILPTISVAVWITFLSREKREELIHNIAVCFWLSANSVWMIGEFFYDDHTRPFALCFFAMGLVTLAIHYLPKWWKFFMKRTDALSIGLPRG